MIINVLIVGYGSAGRRYFDIIKKNFPLIRCKVFSRNNNGKFFIKNISDIKKFKPQLSIICTPATKRIKIINFLANLKSHMLIEKPLAANYKDAKKIANLVKKKKILIKVGYNLRFLNSLKIMNYIIKTNHVGKIYFVNITVGKNLREWRDNQNYKKSVSAQKKLGGGVLLELSHEIDYASWVFGEFNKIFCKNSKISNLKINVEDNAQILLFSKKKKFTTSINLDFCRKDSIRVCHVVGENGTLIWNGLKNKILFFDHNKKKWKNLKFQKNSIENTYLMQIKNMVQICFSKKNIKDNLTNLNNSLKILKLIDCARHSSKHSKIISIK
jgi:predicted dehydrogenase